MTKAKNPIEEYVLDKIPLPPPEALTEQDIKEIIRINREARKVFLSQEEVKRKKSAKQSEEEFFSEITTTLKEG